MLRGAGACPPTPFAQAQALPEGLTNQVPKFLERSVNAQLFQSTLHEKHVLRLAGRNRELSKPMIWKAKSVTKPVCLHATAAVRTSFTFTARTSVAATLCRVNRIRLTVRAAIAFDLCCTNFFNIQGENLICFHRCSATHGCSYRENVVTHLIQLQSLTAGATAGIGLRPAGTSSTHLVRQPTD